MEQLVNIDDEEISLPEVMHHIFISFQDKPNKEKMIVGLTQKTHLTVQFGMQSGVMDIHYSDENYPEGDARRYRTLMSAPHAVAEQLFLHIGIIVLTALKTYYISNRINLGKLTHYNCYLVRIESNKDEVEKLLNSTVKKFKPPKTISKEYLLSRYVRPKDVSVNRTTNCFQVFQLKKGQHLRKGIIWYAPNMRGRNPFFVSMKNFNRMAQTVRNEIYAKCKELRVCIDVDVWNELKGLM